MFVQMPERAQNCKTMLFLKQNYTLNCYLLLQWTIFVVLPKQVNLDFLLKQLYNVNHLFVISSLLSTYLLNYLLTQLPTYLATYLLTCMKGINDVQKKAKKPIQQFQSHKKQELTNSTNVKVTSKCGSLNSNH